MEGEAGAMDDERYAEQDVDRTFEEEDETAYEVTPCLRLCGRSY